MDKIEEFIKRRFKNDCNWTSGNCYYFAIVLADRFRGDIYYDVINGHFVCKVGESYYDFLGKNTDKDAIYIRWNDFPSYDQLQYERIIADCIL